MLFRKIRNFYPFAFFVCLFAPAQASFLNQALDWTIVLGGSYITPFLGTKLNALPKDFDLEKAIAQTPEYIKKLAHEQCEKQQVDPTQFSVIAVPDCGACIWNLSFDIHGVSIQKLVALDKKIFEPPCDFGQAALAHEIGHLQHHHPQKGIFYFFALPLLVQYCASKLAHPQRLHHTMGYALLKVGVVKLIELAVLGKWHEYQADGNTITYCKDPEALRNAANFLRTHYYQNNYVLPAQELKKQWDNSLEKSKFLPGPLKKLCIKLLSPERILNWKLLTNPHPDPRSRAERLEKAGIATR